VNTIIVGTLYPEHLQENIVAAEKGTLPANIYEEVKHRLNAIGIAPLHAA
jgi:hypothetical protein